MVDVAFTTVSSKGQIVIPAFLRERLRLKPGQKLLVAAKGGKLLIEEAGRLESELEDEFAGFLKLSQSSTRFWDNAADEVWERV